MTVDLNVRRTKFSKQPSYYKRLFAYVMATSSAQYDALVASRKQRLLGSLHGSVLEIGAGTGPNLAYYAPDVQWLDIEPNAAMFPYVRREAQRLGINVELQQGESEQLDVADGSVDAVVSTLVLCSVRDPIKTLQEILRVLKPGGQFVFIEHVAAPRETRLRRLQGFVRPLWQTWADGCHPDRETWSVVENAGFSQVQLDHFRLDVPLVGPHIAGVAVK